MELSRTHVGYREQISEGEREGRKEGKEEGGGFCLFVLFWFVAWIQIGALPEKTPATAKTGSPKKKFLAQGDAPYTGLSCELSHGPLNFVIK